MKGGCCESSKVTSSKGVVWARACVCVWVARREVPGSPFIPAALVVGGWVRLRSPSVRRLPEHPSARQILDPF